MSPPTGPLSAFEVAVRGGRGSLSRLPDVAVHAEAHRATGAAPLGSGAAKHLIETFAFGCRLDGHGSRHDKHPHTVGDLASFEHVGDDAQVLDAAVRARTDEHDIDVDVPQ